MQNVAWGKRGQLLRAWEKADHRRPRLGVWQLVDGKEFILDLSKKRLAGRPQLKQRLAAADEIR